MSRIRDYLANVLARLLWWRQPASAEPTARKRRATKAERGTVAQEAGHFYFREHILDQLDSYFIALRRMRRADPEAYALYSKVGASVLPALVKFKFGALEPTWTSGARPGFGAVSFGMSPEEQDREVTTKTITPKFMYFQKYERPAANVQPVNRGDVYRVTIYYDRLDDPKHKFGVPMVFHIHVDIDGTTRLLKEHVWTRERVRSKRGGGYTTIPLRDWQIPRILASAARDPSRSGPPETPEEWATRIFSATVTAHSLAHAAVQVRVSKGTDTAVFGIDVKRTPYFFRDREVTLVASGGRRRIFHIVRAHSRTMESGEERYVRFHFRGERSFTWNGYDVSVSMPDWHHRDVLSFEGGALDLGPKDATPPNTLSEAALGASVARHVVGANWKRGASR